MLVFLQKATKVQSGMHELCGQLSFILLQSGQLNTFKPRLILPAGIEANMFTTKVEATHANQVVCFNVLDTTRTEDLEVMLRTRHVERFTEN